ncbi:DUF2760 domain-containing protein [Lentisphaera marina]|jgi:hypothetical protein|uniref:DUF2760 domain-containing protein n=1 Tax=Lentisphaera marina TaxID=1111041 RepID=UPI0023672608|nr:DUF2760 domain-containing protein [Lentisphaera marina]MDD7987070.1 DUF2760 domain-containing protein [Lentisphaera marina]
MGLATAFKAFFSILGDGEKAELWEKACGGKLIEDTQVKDLESKVGELEGELKSGKTEVSKLKDELKAAASKNDRSDAIYTLTLLQREGRLIDFLKEDIGPYSDEQVGAAVRQIHEGCGKVLEKHFKVQPLIDSAEGDEVEVPKAYDPAKFSLSGQVSGDGPFKGSLVHKGWQASELSLPERSKETDTSVICPSEVDI